MQGEKNAIKDKSVGRATGAYRITISFFCLVCSHIQGFGHCIYPICELVTHTATSPQKTFF